MRNWPILLLLAALFSLQGCATGVALGTLAAIGGGANAVFNDRRHPDAQQEDAKLCETIRVNLENDSFLHGNTRIVPSCFNKIILLTGEAPNEALRQRVLEHAHLSGVRRIHNEVRLRQTLPLVQQEYDTMLHSKIRTVLTARYFNGSSQTSLTVSDANVYLMGLLTREEAARIEAIVRHVEGVQRVISVFEYVLLVPEG
jgi:osmotically-inducible protein OsmY